MAAIGAGSVCVLKRGRRAGERVTVTRVIDTAFAEIRDSKGKVRKSSIMHLEPVG